MPHKKH